MSVLALHKRLQEKGVVVNLKSLYRLTGSQPLQKLSTAPEDRCPDCKTYLLGSGRRLERIDTVGKAQVESSEARSGDASENNRPA